MPMATTTKDVYLSYRFLRLPLVALHLHLQLVHQILKLGHVLLVLFSLSVRVNS